VTSTDQTQTIAAVDLGSNSFHMVVAQVNQDDVQIVDRMKEMVQLGAGLDKNLRIGADTQLRALDCLERFGQRLKSLPRGSVRAVGTNTLRLARENSQFLALAQQHLGHPIEIIAGREEARLIYLGVSHALPMSDEQRLVIDIGGGSTEFIIGRRFDALFRESLHMGCVSMTRRFFLDGTIDRKQMRKAELAAALELQNIQAHYQSIGWHTSIGASGTVLQLAAITQAMGWDKEGLSRSGLKKLRRWLVTQGHADRLTELKGLKPERANILAGGLTILLASFEQLGIKRMTTSDGALREGLLYDLLGRLKQEDVRERSVVILGDRFAIDRAHAERIADTADYIRRAVGTEWNLLDYESQQMLRWTALLQEIGLAVAHNQYHKHGAYLVRNCDTTGFTQNEQHLLALLVRGHRRKIPLAELKNLPELSREHALRLLVIIRLAALLHRSRSGQPLPNFVVKSSERALTLNFSPGWLSGHPLTRADLQQEANYLAAADIQLYFR
jgi:exopolyphosphatase/guanosine-5'-triphosphate,3'-diphosphate pyrophosphatase